MILLLVMTEISLSIPIAMNILSILGLAGSKIQVLEQFLLKPSPEKLTKHYASFFKVDCVKYTNLIFTNLRDISTYPRHLLPPPPSYTTLEMLLSWRANFHGVYLPLSSLGTFYQGV